MNLLQIMKVTNLSYLLLELNFVLNWINSTLFKFIFCFHSIIIFVVNCVLWNDWNGKDSKYILLEFHHFNFLRHKILRNRLRISLRDLHIADMIKTYSNFYRLWHCLKSVQIRSFFWSLFSCIRNEYWKIRTRQNSVFGHFSRSVKKYCYFFFIISLALVCNAISHDLVTQWKQKRHSFNDL